MDNFRKFWPLDYDSEDEIFENPSWDLPGWNRRSLGRRKTHQGRVQRPDSGQ